MDDICWCSEGFWGWCGEHTYVRAEHVIPSWFECSIHDVSGPTTLLLDGMRRQARARRRSWLSTRSTVTENRCTPIGTLSQARRSSTCLCSSVCQMWITSPNVECQSAIRLGLRIVELAFDSESDRPRGQSVSKTAVNRFDV